MKTKHTPQKRFIEVAQALKAGEKVTIEDLSAQELEFVMTMVNEPDILGFWELAKDEDINELKKTITLLRVSDAQANELFKKISEKKTIEEKMDAVYNEKNFIALQILIHKLLSESI